jgi:hypothetical protein
VVEATDGYMVAFGLGDVDSTLTGRRLILADSLNGGPLPAGEAP